MSSANRSKSVAAVGVALAVVLATLAVFTSTASADSPYPPATGGFTLKVTAAGTDYAYGNGPGPTIPNVTDGQSVHIALTNTGGSSTFARLKARQCKASANVSDIASYSPQVTNYCSSATLGAGSPGAFVDSGPVSPGTTSIGIDFKIGAGHAPDIEDAVFGNLLPGFDCGPGNACKIVVQVEVSSGVGSSNFLSFPITFFSAAPSDLVLMDCSNVAMTGAIKAPLDNTVQSNVAISLKSTVGVATQYPRTCTGASATAAGPLTKVAGKFIGDASCSASAHGPATEVAPNGKLKLTWSTLDSKGKQLSSSVYLRLDQTADLVDDVGVSNGLVTKGVGVGADIRGSMLFQPTQKKNGPANQSTLNANGTIAPGAGSLQIATNCAAGIGTIDAFVASTDGTTLAGAAFDGKLQIVLPA